MNWFGMINVATAYIEENITKDIILEDIAYQCNVSYHYFTKTFSMITGYSLKEYIRNRRITLASYEVSNTSHRILDIGIKYGYSSNEAFSRAFKNIHGINPSMARKGNITIYTHFPVLKYKVTKQHMLSLQYEIIKDIDDSFFGKGIKMQETEDQYDEAQYQQQSFFDNVQLLHPSNQTIYRVLYNLSPGYLNYDFFVGYKQEDYHNQDNLEILNITAPKAVRFISPNIAKEDIPEIKLIIYNEWDKNNFKADLIFEMEYIIEQENDMIDFFYLVSIK